ncbi:MAG: peroxiredoxin family protein [Thermodesulfobacteriota bacterium]
MIGKRVLRLLLCFLLAIGGCSGGKEAKKLKIGDVAPDFTATDLNGQPISLAGYQGKPVILRFWSTDCKYCRADTPIFNQYFEKYREAGLRVVYVNRNSDEATVRGFVSDLEIGFPVVLDRDGAISEAYTIKVEPQTVVIGPDHRILAAILGGVSEEELRRLLGGFLEPPPAGAPQPR